MAAAGAVLVRTMNLLAGKIRPGVTTLELDQAAEKFIRSQGCDAGLQGLPRLPGLDLRLAELDGRARDPRRLRSSQRGDILSVDIGVMLDGWVADAARTFAVGPITPAPRSCSTCDRGVAAPAGRRSASPATASATSPTRSRRTSRPPASRSCAASSATASAASMHEDPQIPNYGSPDTGVLLEEGMVLAVEPMVTAGQPRRPGRRRRLVDLLRRRLARRPLRVHDRDHRRRSAYPDAMARGR